MFSNCNDLTELNRLRIQKITEGVPVVSVNKEYNKRRRELLEVCNSNSKEIPFIRVSADRNAIQCGLEYVDISQDPYKVVIK